MHKLEELEFLIDRLREYRVAIEFRNRNWVIGDQLRSTIDFLKQRKVAFVNVDAPSAEHFTIMPSDLNEITTPELAYLRLHGRNARGYLSGKTVAARFDYNYNDDEVAEIAERSNALAHKTRELHVIFNNNNLDYAPRAAARLREALGQLIVSPPQTPELF
jgi:uncharacterized protein YecE (DUF72 family)